MCYIYYIKILYIRCNVYRIYRIQCKKLILPLSLIYFSRTITIVLTLQMLNVCTARPKRQINLFNQQRQCLKQQNLPWVHSVKNGIDTDY